MSCPDNLSKHDADLWDVAMRWPIRAGAVWKGFTAIEDTRAHGCPMCTDGLRHTFYLHYEIVGYLFLLDRILKPLMCLYNAYAAIRMIVRPILYRIPGYWTCVEKRRKQEREKRQEDPRISEFWGRIEKKRKQRREQCQEDQRGA